MDWYETMINGANFDLAIRGALEGRKKVSRIMKRWMMITPFKMANPAPKVLPSHPRKAFINKSFRNQPVRLERKRTEAKIAEKLINGRN